MSAVGLTHASSWLLAGRRPARTRAALARALETPVAQPVTRRPKPFEHQAPSLQSQSVRFLMGLTEEDAWLLNITIVT